MAANAGTGLNGNLQRLLAEFVEVAANPPPSAGRIASGMGVACCVPGNKFDSVATGGWLLSQIELIRLGKVSPPDPTHRNGERILGTANDVFTYAGPCRYSKGRRPVGVGLLFRWEIEEGKSSEAVATPFDSGAVFKYLRPSDVEHKQIDFVRRHELPVPGYRQLLEQYLTAFFTDPVDYIRGVDPHPEWPIPVKGGDARRWTFEVRFRERLSVNNQLLAAFVPKKIWTKPQTMAQIIHWRKAGVDVQAYDSPDGLDARQLETLTASYLTTHLGL